jgi:hypothetical protein
MSAASKSCEKSIVIARTRWKGAELRMRSKILALTLWRVIARRSLSESGYTTAREFMGSAPASMQ